MFLTSDNGLISAIFLRNLCVQKPKPVRSLRNLCVTIDQCETVSNGKKVCNNKQKKAVQTYLNAIVFKAIKEVEKICITKNPFMHNGLCYVYKLDEFIHHFEGGLFKDFVKS